jgi:polyketide cyclase/dehydrase/lipid transport protein
MEIRSDRRFEFDHDAATVWTALTHVERYPVWWPWLQCDGVALVEGERWACQVDPPLPYTLHFDVTIVEVVAERLVRAELTGDLVGAARLTLNGGVRTDGCTIRLESSLAAIAGPARLVARFAGPIARFGHDWVLDTGARRFRSALHDRPGDGQAPGSAPR